MIDDNFLIRQQKGIEYRRKLKLQILCYYSNSLSPTCAHCSFSDIRALSVDHIDNNGAEHRQTVIRDRASHALHRWLKKNNYPTGFQVLCMNCQLIKRYGTKNYLVDSANKKYRKEDVSTAQI
jgi:hypothetical protein